MEGLCDYLVDALLESGSGIGGEGGEALSDGDGDGDGQQEIISYVE